MEMRMDGGREFWRGVLVAGGFTAIPRWTCNPVTDVVEHEPTIPDGLVAALRRLADELAVPLGSVLLAAHAKVLAALSGEHEVATGYVAVQGDQPAQTLPCRLTTQPDSWRTLLLDTHRAESELLSHKNFPVDDLRRELGLTEPYSRQCSIRPATAAISPRAPCCGWESRNTATNSCCGCGTAATCSTRTALPGSAAITSPRSR
jgi:non-ribosomal peptide synthetase component F